MASLVRPSFLPFGLDLLARQISPSAKCAARVLHGSGFYLSAPFSLALPHDDPSLRALHEPYPSNPPNGAIFEAESVEYIPDTRAFERRRIWRQRRITSRTILSHTAQANAQLLSCISNRDYAGAIALRRDLEALHTPIAPHERYAKVAQYLLNNPDTSDPYAFLHWLELLPPTRQPWANYGSIPPTVNQLLSHLLERPEAIDPLYRFSILVARKGLARWVAIPAISQVTRYSTPETASKLLADLVDAASTNAAQSGASTIPPKVLRSWNSTFLRTLCLSGRLDAAYHSLVALHTGHRTVSPNVYRIIAEELEQLGRLDQSNHVRSLFEQSGFSRPHFPAAFIPAATVRMPRDSITSQLSWVKTRITAGKSISATDLAFFMKSYLSTGRRRALSLLRNRLLRLSQNARWKSDLSIWATAEMQLYRSEGRHEEALSVFQSVFSPVGVTTQLLRELRIQPSSKPGRLWPPSEAITLAAWSAAALAASHEDHGALERCYLYFLQSCNPPSNTLFRLPPAMLPDAAAFQPWIGAFARRMGPEAVMRIMKDMKDLGVPPTIMTWNALAKAYVTNNEWEIAKSIVSKMEKSRYENPASSSSTSNARLRNRLGPIADWGFPAATTSTYYLLLRELLATNQVSASKELANMFIRNGHQSNDWKLDWVLRGVAKKDK